MTNSTHGPDIIAIRAAAICAGATALTTALLWALGQAVASPSSFVEAVALHGDAAYRARLWVNFVHVVLALIAYACSAQLLAKVAPLSASLSVLFLSVWAAIEAIGVSISIYALNDGWRAGYAGAPPDQQRDLALLMLAWADIWNALFFVVLVAFLLGSLFLGLAFLSRRDRFAKLCGITMLLAVPLTGLIMAGGYFGQDWATAVTDIVYPFLQPASRFLLAIWLWSAVANTRANSDNSDRVRSKVKVTAC